MTPILYSSDEVDFLNNGLGQLVDSYDVDIHEQRNGLLNLTAYYPVNGQHYGDISEGNIILAKPSPLDDNHAFRIVSVALDITGYAVMIEADSITYDLTNNLSKTIHMLGDGQAAMAAIQKSTFHPHIFTFYSDITHTSESQLRYVNPMEAIAGTQGSFLQIWGGELKRENRRVAMFNRRGRDNVATFRLGKNIAGLKYTVDVSKLTTEIVPTVTVNSTDVSRTIEGATVQSSRMGNYPLVYSKMVDVSQDVKVDEGDTDDQIKAKINAFAADWFVQSANTGKDLPEVTVEVEVESLQDSADYADKFAKLETIGLTDTVTVYVPEFGVNVTAIVNELHYDPVAERVTKLSIGTAKTSWADSNKNALNDLQDKVTKVQEQATQAVVSTNGKNSTYSGRNEPAHPQEGDTWFWNDGTDSGIRVFTNGDWVDSADTKTFERINNAVDGAIETSKTYTDELNEKQVQTTNALNEKVDKSVKELTDSQQAISSQATAYTNSAVADANAKAVQIGQTTAQNAQKSLDEKTTTLQQSIDTKVAKTDYDKKTGELTTNVNRAQQTADSATQTIGTYQQSNDKRVASAETNIKANSDAIALTVSKTDFDKATGKLSGDISSLEQRADGFDATVTKVNNLAVGGRNLLTNTAKDISVTSHTTDGYPGWANINTGFSFENGKTYTFSSEASNSSDKVAEASIRVFEWITNTQVGIYAFPADGKRHSVTFAIPNDSHNYNLLFYAGHAGIAPGVDVTTTYHHPKLEAGNIATDWSPAPEDVDTQLAQVKLTADGVYQTVNNPTTGLNTRVSTAEGNINKVQGTVSGMSNTVKETADGLTREIADRKTGDSNTLQAGKDFTTSQIKNYDSGVQSQITQASNAIMASVSGVNLLSNTTFDNNGAGWTKRSSGDANTIFVGKTELPNTPSYLQTSSNSQAWTGLEQVIKAIPGTIYNVSSYLVSTKNSGIAQLYVRFEDASNKNLTNFMQVGASTGTDWIQVNKDFTAPSNTAYLRFSFQNQMANSAVAMTMPQITEGAGVKLYSPVKYAMDNQTVLQLFQDNWAIGIKDNAGNLINGINGDTSGMTIAAKKLTVSADTTFLGNNWLNGAIIKNASIGGAQIAKASITDANILNLDVNKISGEVANFIRAYWDGQYGSTSITSEGMTVTAGVTTTVFDENGMQLNKSNRSVGRIGVNDLYQDNSKKGLFFGLESTGDFMAWGAQNYAGNPFDTKLSWYRVGSVPSNLIGTIEGFNFQDNVLFNRPVEMRAGIKVQGTDDRLVTRTTSLNGRKSPSFGTSSAGFAYVSDEVYLISNGTAYNLSKVIKALSGISNAAIPTGFASDGKATGWYNVNFR